MNPQDAKILLDECLPRPFVLKLVEFVNQNEDDGPLVCHLFDFAPSGTFDEDWIPRVSEEAWTIISADGGRKPNKGRGRKLPDLCSEYGITLILLSPSIHSRKAFDKIRTIVSVWDQIVSIAGDPLQRGRRFMLEPLNPDNLGVGRIMERIIKPRST